MKVSQLVSVASALFASGALAHSWVECIDTEVDLDYYMKNPSKMNDWAEKCHGYPRNLPARPREGYVAAADWIDESSNYSYEFLERENDDVNSVYACRANQRTPTVNGPPAATVTPGQEILIRYWGNGHGTADPMYQNPQGRDPGVVRIHWSGQKETDIVYKKDLNEATWIQGAQQAFEKYAIIDFSEDRVDTLVKVGPHTGEHQKRMKEWALYMKFKVPEEIEEGRHQMVWVWAWDFSTGYSGGDMGSKEGDKYNKNFQPSYTTCFDLNVVNSSYKGANKVQAKKIASYDPATANADLCATKCQKGGMPGDAYTCDPTKEKCPVCRIATSSGPACFEECNGFFSQGTTCPATVKKAKRSTHVHMHKRHH